MRLLLDTHALLWWAHEPESLSREALDAIADNGNEILVSPVSAMEIATKDRTGKLGYSTPLASQFVALIAEFGFQELPLSCKHAQQAGQLVWDHKDPWDRLFVAQARTEGIKLVSKDEEILDFDVPRLW